MTNENGKVVRFMFIFALLIWVEEWKEKRRTKSVSERNDARTRNVPKPEFELTTTSESFAATAAAAATPNTERRTVNNDTLSKHQY